MILYLVVESAPKRFLLETDGESNEEKQEIDENAATSGVRGWMDRINRQNMIRDGKEGFGREKRNRKSIFGSLCIVRMLHCTCGRPGLPKCINGPNLYWF